jgi:hypothetical protein
LTTVLRATRALQKHLCLPPRLVSRLRAGSMHSRASPVPVDPSTLIYGTAGVTTQCVRIACARILAAEAMCKRRAGFKNAPEIRVNRTLHHLRRDLQAIMLRCCVLGLLSACSSLIGPTMSDVVRARAATDLDCTVDRISLYPETGGLIAARGCGAWTRYACSYVGGDPTCREQQPAESVPDTVGTRPLR